ncbi:MAG TPA: DNA/RNA non-specific endonuclease [Pyrinomonadaceae bacterium]|nr:DNA/RNA non-specific endonuclease [Pyrinomonadaceae bacterium]
MSRLKKFQSFTHSNLRFATVIGLVLIFAIVSLRLGIGEPTAHAVSADIVISQVYGGGGNAGSTYKNDFIELFNHGSSPVSLNGWSVQYASATGTTWQVTNLTNLTLQPGQYYLVQEALGAGGTINLPTPDATGTIAMGATAGKVALVNTTTALTGSGCPFGATVVDFIGFGGTASCSEGTFAPAPSNTTADIRALAGCTDTDANSTDFATGAPTPRNTASPLNACAGGPSPSPTPSASPTPTATPTPTPSPTPSPSPTPVQPIAISQVYGGGGNSGSNYKNDYVEIFNRGTSPVDLTNWSVQYASAAGSFGGGTSKTTLSGTINPGQYYLVQLAAGAGGTTDLPTPDATGGTNLSASDGKIALVSNNNLLSGTCPIGTAGVADFVGYGNASCFEGTGPAPAIDNLNADFRTHLGCRDTDLNISNFAAATANPRNTASPISTCPAGDFPPEVFTTSPSNNGTHVAIDSSLTINFDEPVDVTGTWYQISCASTGVHTAAVTGGPGSFVLNPAVDFGYAEQCTVTIFAAQVTDQDTDDPPNNPASDYVFIFTTEVFHDPAEHLIMGNPTNATADPNITTNYLMMKTQYALSFNNDRGIPNWTSWHLDSSWRGSAPRQDDFRNDTTLPPNFHQIQGTDYSGSGFDRGHMCPSADRTSSIPDNSATFLMTNMVPQAPDNNQGPWANLENDLRGFLSGNELYIVSGGQGTGGVGTNGAANTIAGGFATVPAFTWKVALILPVGDNDLSRVDANTRSIAVIMPNTNGIRSDDWRKYLATVDQVENLTGYDLFSNLPAAVQDAVEAKPDAANDTAPVTVNQNRATPMNTNLLVTLNATDFNVNNTFTFLTVAQPQHGMLSGSGATLTYSPDNNFTGPDSFTFKANDGALDSNVSTININVTAPSAANASLSGRVTDGHGAGLAGVVLHLFGSSSAAAMTDNNGNYHFANLETNSAYTLQPALANYHFSPENLSISLIGNKTDAVFTAVADADVTTNAIESPEFFVRQQYLDFLGREPDSNGFRYWANQLTACGTDAACMSGKRIGVSAAFFVEQEFQDTGSFIYRTYRAAFNERPRYNQFNQDRLQVVGGSDVQARRGAFLDAFVARSEFQQRYPASLSNDAFVEQLSNSVGADGVTRQELKDALASGATRAQILGRLIDLPEFKAREYNPGFVLTQYFGYLRRDPDQSGYNFWLNVLNGSSGGTNYRGMVCSFLTSAEYQLRFSSVVTRSNNECR